MPLNDRLIFGWPFSQAQQIESGRVRPPFFDINSRPFVIGLAKTLIQVAQYHTGATSKEIDELKRLASNLPGVPFDLTAKNKTLFRQLVSERLRAKLYFLPEQLMGEVGKELERGRGSLRRGPGCDRD